METAIFEKAKYLTWQEQWPETTECVHCKEQAELILAVQESAGLKEPIYICDRYENGGKSGEWWAA